MKYIEAKLYMESEDKDRREGYDLYIKTRQSGKGTIDALVYLLAETKRAGRTRNKILSWALYIAEKELLERYTVEKQAIVLSDGTIEKRIKGVTALPPKNQSAYYCYNTDIFYILMQHGYVLDDQGYWWKNKE